MTGDALTLDRVWDAAWDRLEVAVRDRKSPFHTMTVATVRPDGSPTARTVVLRGACRDRRVLRFHTDRRSPKLVDLAADARVCLMLYDPVGGLQFRLDGRARPLIDDPAADQLWQATRSLSRACYRQVDAPGVPVAQPGTIPPAADGDLHGRQNFTPVEVLVHRLDWLDLRASGHIRALFDWSDGSLNSGWIAP